mgnify:FL=1
MDEEIGRFYVSVYHIIFVYNFESNAYLCEYVLHLVLTEPPTFGFDVTLEVLLTVLQKEVEMFSSFGRFIEFYDVGTFEFHEDFDLSTHYFFIFDVFEKDCFYGQQLVFVVLDVATIDCAKATFS